MTSITDVAVHAGLSTATVSRALRGLPGVSDATRERVRSSATALGYVASTAASGLASGHTNAVAVVVPHVTRWYFGQVVEGAEEVLREQGFDLLLFNLSGNAAARHRVMQTHVLTKRVDAVLILGITPTEAELAWFDQHAPPAVLLGSQVPHWPSVRIDDEQAARTAMRHLLDLGHRRIGYVGGGLDGPLDFTTPQDRLHGYRRSLSEAGIAHDPDLETVADFTVQGGVVAGSLLLGRPVPPTAVFCASDEMAIGVLRSARLAGLGVPEDVSVIGIDDHEMAPILDLTTVRQPVREQGRHVARQVVELLSRRRHPADPRSASPPAPEHLVMPTELVVRSSTGPIPPSPAADLGAILRG